MPRKRRGPDGPGVPASLLLHRTANGWRSTTVLADGGLACGRVALSLTSAPTEAQTAWVHATEAVTRTRLTVRGETLDGGDAWTGTVTDAAPA